MLPMDNPIAQENIRRHISESKCYKNIFDEDELDYIWKQSFCGHGRPRLNANGTVLISGGELTKRMYNEFKNKIDPLLKDANKSPAIGGNYFITPQQYGLHNDSIRPEDWQGSLKTVYLKDYKRRYTCYKNIIIPLWIGTNQKIKDGGQIVFFDQRHIDWATVYNAGNLTKSISSVYNISYNYSELIFHDGKGNLIPKEKIIEDFDKKIYDQVMNTPYERLKGLSVENIFDWVPGSPCVFDAVQLHNTNMGSNKKKNWNSKMGLLLTFLVELDKDLKEEWFLV